MARVLKDFSAQTLAEAIDGNQIGFSADLGRSPLVQLHDDPEVRWFFTGIPFAGFNRVLHARFEANDVDAKILTTLARFRSRKVPMM